MRLRCSGNLQRGSDLYVSEKKFYAFKLPTTYFGLSKQTLIKLCILHEKNNSFSNIFLSAFNQETHRNLMTDSKILL